MRVYDPQTIFKTNKVHIFEGLLLLFYREKVKKIMITTHPELAFSTVFADFTVQRSKKL